MVYCYKLCICAQSETACTLIHMLISENIFSPTFNDVYVGPLYDIKFCEEFISYEPDLVFVL